MYKVKLFYDNEEREIDYARLEYRQQTNLSTGKPCAELEGGYIHLEFTPRGDEDYFLANWMFANRTDIEGLNFPNCMYKLKKGEVVFYEGDYDGRILFKYRFEDCVPILYRETFHHLRGMKNYIVLSAAIQYYKTKDPNPWLKQWNESWTPPEELMPIHKEEDKTPKIVDCYYTDLEGNKQAEPRTGEKVYVVVETQNAIGKTIDIDLSNHSKDFIYNDKVIENDIIKDFKITTNVHKIKLRVIVQQDGEREALKEE